MTEAIVDFLRARLDEAAADAEALSAEQWTAETDVGDEYNRGVVVNDHETVASCGVEGLDDGEVRARHIARHDPAHVLRDIAAKRRRLEALAEAVERGVYITAVYTAEDALRDEAAVYDQHPDYQETWRP